jgi:hypothetical protein
VISVEKLAFAIAKINEGFNVVAEVVDNPGKQKGGNVLKSRSTGKSFLIETSNVKGDKELVKLLEKAGEVSAPYNAFRLVYNVGSLKNILKEKLPYNLRFKDGYFYLEAVTGDMTQMLATKAKFMSSGEEIHDFKDPKNIDDALQYLRKSDDQLDKAMTINYQHPTSQDVINAIESPRWSGLRGSFIDSYSGRVKDILAYSPLKNGIGLHFYIPSTFNHSRDVDNFMEFDSIFLNKLVPFLRAKFPTKIAMVSKSMFNAEKGTTSAEIMLADRAQTTAPFRSEGVAKAAVGLKAPGGIDLASKNLNMESSGQRVNITFDPAMIEQFKRGDFSGVKIQILDVVPVNLMPLLGLKEEGEAGQIVV